MNPPLAVLEKQYFFLQGSLPDLMSQGATPEELDAIRKAIVQSRTNYWKAINGVLHDDDPEVKSLVSQMNAAQLNLEAGLKTLGNVAKVLNVITKAVDIGSQIAAKVVAL
jgi:hypothetical protein